MTVHHFWWIIWNILFLINLFYCSTEYYYDMLCISYSQLVNILNNGHTFFKRTSWLLHNSCTNYLLFPILSNANNKRNGDLINSIASFRGKLTTPMIMIVYVILKPGKVVKYFWIILCHFWNQINESASILHLFFIWFLYGFLFLCMNLQLRRVHCELVLK